MFDDQAVIAQEEREYVAFATLKEDWRDFPALIEAIAEYYNQLKEILIKNPQLFPGV